MHTVVGHPRMMHVVFAGPFGVGKTTAVRSISDSRPVTTEVYSTIVHRARLGGSKTATTVGLDYGEWTGPGNRRVAIIGTPGQKRFSLIRQTALAAGAGVVLWVFGNRTDSLGQTAEWLRRMEAETSLSTLVLAITRTELDSGPPLGAYRDVLDSFQSGIPFFAADPRRRDQTSEVVECAVSLMSSRVVSTR